MKTTMKAVLIAGLLMANAVMADTTMKIGVVNVRELMTESPQAIAMDKILEKEFSPRKNAIITAQKALQERMQKYQKDGQTMSESERKKTEKDLTEKQRDVQRMEQEFREDGQTRQREETEKVLKKMSEVINAIAARDGYDLILNHEAAPFASPKVEITQRVLDDLKKSK